MSESTQAPVRPRTIGSYLSAIRIRLLRLCVALGYLRPIAMRLLRCIKVFNPSPTRDCGGRKTRVLALNSERFRGELECLVDTGEYEVLIFPVEDQQFIRSLLLDGMRADVTRSEYWLAGPETDVGLSRARLQERLSWVIQYVGRKLGVQCVIGASVWYTSDVDWGKAASDSGMPYVVMHIENLSTAPGHYDRIVENFRGLGKFAGDHIICHNDTTASALAASGFVAKSRVSALGCPRMDAFVEKVREAEGASPPQSPKQVVLFSFHRGTGLWGVSSRWPDDPGEGLYQFFTNVHQEFIHQADKNPDVQFVIKLKWGVRWIEEIEKVALQEGYRTSSMTNLSILVEADVHDLILKSDVVCGYGSTTLLEAGIASKPVIMPLFDEATKPIYADYVQFRDCRDAFHIAESREEFGRLISENVRTPDVDFRRKAACDALFEEHVSALSGGATAAYSECLQQQIRLKADAPKA